MEINNSPIISFFNKRKVLGEEERLFLNEVFEEKELGANETVLEKGGICKYIYFIETGALKTCFLDSNGKEVINGIAIENNFCTSVASFINQSPSTEFIKTIEKTRLIYINFRNFKRLMETYPVYRDIYIKILEDYVSFMTWRLESVLMMTAKERYDSLMKIYPKLFLRISNKEMAEYLGMSAETLSRAKHQQKKEV